MKSKTTPPKKPVINKTDDLPDSAADQKKMRSEEIIIDMPEVKDIPGQENIKVPRIREMEDITASSDDEEGKGILDDLNKDDIGIEMDNQTNVSKTEASLLQQSAGHTPNEERIDLEKIALNNTDDEGAELNEKNFSEDRFGEDLDVPGAELDDEEESEGNEDEENNLYSNKD